MPNNKKKRLTDLLTIRGKSVTDGVNQGHAWDSNLKKAPANMSPDNHITLYTPDTFTPPQEPRKKKESKLEQEMKKRKLEPTYPTRLYDKFFPNNSI